MKLIDVIKTKNGLNYLGHFKEVISAAHGRLTMDVPYEPQITYTSCEFSFKEYVRKFNKAHVTSTYYYILQTALQIAKYKKIVDFLRSFRYDFDGDYFEIEKDGSFTFMPYNKEQTLLPNGSIDLNCKGRQKTTLFKFFKKIMSEQVATEQEIQDFTNWVIATVVMDLEIVFVSGKEIGKSYHNDKTTGWNASSCMSGQNLIRFHLYNDNVETCQLGKIVNKINGEVVGRFIRWFTNELGWVEDRVYFKFYSVYEWYKERSIKEDVWIRQNSQTYKKGDLNTKKADRTYNKRLTTNIVKPLKSYEHPPYLDSMSYYAEKKGVPSLATMTD